MQFSRREVIVLAAVALAACGEATTPDPEPQPNSAVVDQRLVTAYTGFGFKLFEEIVRQQGAKNIFLSPSSVAFALAMTYHGAAGETRDAMARVLEIEGITSEDVARANAAWRASLTDPDPKVELSVANSIWAREGVPFKSEFLQLNRDFYGAEVATLDFNRPDASRTINDWVSRSTGGKIQEIVPARIDPDVVMYLINAIYFLGTWTEPFNRKLTRPGDFTLPDGTVIQHPMMMRDGNYGVLEGQGFRAVHLPYGSGRLGMYVFLPDRDSELAALYQRLDAGEWERWMAGFQKQRILLRLPRFRLEYEANLNEVLKPLGMEIAFNPLRANFEGMLPREFLDRSNAYISNVKHKTFVEVNEEGTEAAGATSVEISVTSAPPEFVVDRPFFVAIRDNETGTVLFVGQIVEPK